MAKLKYMEMDKYMDLKCVQKIIKEIESININCVISVAAMIEDFDLTVELLAINSTYRDNDDLIKESIVTRKDRKTLLQHGFYENDFGNFLKEYNYKYGDY